MLVPFRAEQKTADARRWEEQAKQLEEERSKWLQLLDTENAQLKTLFDDAKSGKEKLIQVRRTANP